MVKIKRAQDGIAADAAMAKRAAPSPAENLARRSGATRMDKRHHGDAAAHADMVKRALAGDYGQVDKRDLPLFQGLLSLLNQVYPGSVLFPSTFRSARVTDSSFVRRLQVEHRRFRR